MQIHNIQRAHPNKKARRVGRGGVHGKTSGRGTKGQKARAGHRIRPEIRDTIKKLPKKRGYGKNRAKSVIPTNIETVVLNLDTIEAKLPAGNLTKASLVEAGLVSPKKGKIPEVKLLSRGEVAKKYAVSGVSVSVTAKEKIIRAGGSVL